MKTLEDQLSQYAAYHRDARNIATHFIGIPMIVVGVAVLLSRPAIELAGIAVSPALLAGLAASFYYLKLDWFLGVIMSVLMALSVWAGALLATESTALWLSAGVGLFVVGWAFQFIGHFWEGKKPAFIDDVAGLIIGPLFVVAEALFMLGALPKLRTTIEGRAGHIRSGKTSAA
ncbi:DUF962 domain-containing protein [Halopseudomonas pelagia]|uniref:DUF962 domain-containing protein n=1 Tax=Halopseudomonas pelagia TaxID=553151 RepID=A0AA91U5E2_9GAMM|nr:Mpo1-like protein [Halopseudomonas pelagia]PCD01139.1 hypothetical protein CO192_01485 [Halopseudomonas pelagia]QFY57045.1 DUF962 domain-containing protein [Halopseudomonas pelagia]